MEICLKVAIMLIIIVYAVEVKQGPQQQAQPIADQDTATLHENL